MRRDVAERGTIFTLLDDPETIAKQGISKILWSDEPERTAKVQAELPRKLHAEDVTYFTSGPRYLEFVDEKVSKGAALVRLAVQFGTESDAIIAIGDGMNDRTMLEYAGLGIAMGNAPDKLKAVADFITGTNEEDGVAQAIERFIVSGS